MAQTTLISWLTGLAGRKRGEHSTSADLCARCNSETRIYLKWTVVLLLVTLLTTFLRSQNKPKGKLPPGSKRFSLFGETSAFWRDPFTFLNKKRAQYGEIYVVKLFGKSKIVTTTPEAARYLLVNLHRSFKHGYLSSITRITDPEANFTDPDNNIKVRRLLKNPLGPEYIHQGIPTYDALACSIISTWKDGETLNIYHQMERITLKCTLNLLWGQQDSPLEYERVMELHSAMSNGFRVMFPINLPFTAYGKALNAKREFTVFMEEKLAQLRCSTSQHDDCMSSIIHSDENDGMTDAQVNSLMLSLIFASYRTTALALAWVFKFLCENPKVLETLKKEHDTLFEARESAGANLSWAEVRQMQYTQKVIQETLRMAALVKYIPRVALEDVEYKGYVIPKGWSLGVSYEFHMDPALFPDPHTFNPDRFNNPIKPGSLIPFGAGGHVCVGIEFTKILLPIIIHRVISQFSFERDGPEGVVFWPQYCPQDGFPMKVKWRAATSPSMHQPPVHWPPCSEILCSAERAASGG